MLLAPPTTDHPLLVLHGFAGQPHAWDDALVGLDVEVTRLRLPGHGPEPELVGESFEDVVDTLADELGGLRCDVAAYSMGARVALGLMVRHPERVRRAVLVGAHPGIARHEREARRAWDDRWARRIEEEGLQAFASAWAALPLFASQRGLPEARREQQQRDRRAHTPEGLAWAMRHLGAGRMPSYWDALTKVRAEVTLVVGELDDKYVAMASRMAGRLPRAEVVVVPAVGHNVVLEAPRRCGEALATVAR